MGVDIVKAALEAGHYVVATGGNTDSMAKARRERFNCETDVTTNPTNVEAAVNTPLQKFGRIDGIGKQCHQLCRRLFRKVNTGEIGQQLRKSLIGPTIVTRAVLPLMRKQRSW